MNDTTYTAAYAIAYLVPGNDTIAELGVLCKTEDCAIRSISPLEGRRVLGVATIPFVFEDIIGLDFMLRHVQGPGTPTPVVEADGYEAMHAQLLDMLGATDQVDAARIIAAHHARELGAHADGLNGV
ncbi:MAG: hypothetical protein ACREP7_15375 [Lysobacter sp.]